MLPLPSYNPSWLQPRPILVLTSTYDKSHDHHQFFLAECDKDIGDDERSIEGEFVRRIFMPTPEDVHILPFEEVGVNQQRERVSAASPPRKKSRLSYGRKPHNESHWWLEHLTPAIRERIHMDVPR